MSYFNVCVLLPRNGSTPKQMEDKASDMLAKFDINKEVEPYKTYVEAKEIQRMAEHFGIDSTNLSALAEKYVEWNGEKGGVDENGLYVISTKNPEGYVDSWSVFTEVKPEDRGRLLFGQDGEVKVVRALVTPDGKWIDGPWVYCAPNAEQEKEFEEWFKKLAALLEENKNTVAFLADCHY